MMGQAKQRGTYEQRYSAAMDRVREQEAERIKRLVAARANRTPTKKGKEDKAVQLMAAILLMTGTMLENVPSTLIPEDLAKG